MSLAKRSPLAQAYNDMHALMVGVGKNYCLKSDPHCQTCPLQRFLPLMRDAHWRSYSGL
jgi:endonuclease III